MNRAGARASLGRRGRALSGRSARSLCGRLAPPLTVWTALGFALAACELAPPEAGRRPLAEVLIETGELERFARAFEDAAERVGAGSPAGETGAGLADADCAPLARYLEEGGPTLRAFVGHAGPTGLCEAVRAEPDRYRALAANLDALVERAQGLPGLLVRWRSLHPAAPLPDIELVVGANGRDAEILDGRIVIAAEGLREPEDLDPVVARELGRAAQRHPRFLPVGIPRLAAKDTWSARAIREGSPDFVAMLVTGRLPVPELHAWGRPLERELWERFEPAAEDRAGRAWLDERALDDPPPADPVRFLGYRIVEAFWARSATRPQALREILSVRDFEDFLERSGYAGEGPSEAEPPSLRGFAVGTWPGFDCTRIRVGDARLHTCAAGEGEVPVVLEADPELDHRSWHRVAPELARTTRVVVYDRSGSGQSEPGPEPRTPARLAHELAALLEVAAGPGPHLLVSHAPQARHVADFQALHPWRTAGAMLLPPREELGAHDVVRRVRDALAGISTDSHPPPGMAGEPVGCWRPIGAGWGEAGEGRTVRLAFLPGGVRRAPEEAAHPLVDVPTGTEIGRWRPLGRAAIELAWDGSGARAGGALPEGVRLERIADGRWVGGAGSVSLLPRPCELPT